MHGFLYQVVEHMASLGYSLLYHPVNMCTVPSLKGEFPGRFTTLANVYLVL